MGEWRVSISGFARNMANIQEYEKAQKEGLARFNAAVNTVLDALIDRASNPWWRRGYAPWKKSGSKDIERLFGICGNWAQPIERRKREGEMYIPSMQEEVPKDAPMFKPGLHERAKREVAVTLRTMQDMREDIAELKPVTRGMLRRLDKAIIAYQARMVGILRTPMDQLPKEPLAALATRPEPEYPVIHSAHATAREALYDLYYDDFRVALLDVVQELQEAQPYARKASVALANALWGKSCDVLDAYNETLRTDRKRFPMMVEETHASHPRDDYRERILSERGLPMLARGMQEIERMADESALIQLEGKRTLQEARQRFEEATLQRTGIRLGRAP